MWITFDGHLTKEIAEREVAAWRRFFALRHMLRNNNIALKYRLRLLISCVLSSMYWCAGSWILTRTQCTHLRAVQDHMLRKMIYVPRSPEESTESHMTRWSRLLRNCRTMRKIMHGDETYFAYCTAGHMRPCKRDKQDVLEQNHDVVAQFEKGVGYTMSWSAFSCLEMGTSSGTMYWR